MLMEESASYNGGNEEDLEILKSCRDIERVAEESYRHYADIFKDHPRIKSLWERIADDEKYHAHRFELAIKLREGMVEEMNGDAFMVWNSLKFLQSILVAMRKSRPNANEALRSAMKFEEHLAQFHLACNGFFREERYKNLFSAVLAGDNEHLELLQHEYENLLHNQYCSA